MENKTKIGFKFMSQRCAIAVSDLTKCYDKLLAVDTSASMYTKVKSLGSLDQTAQAKPQQ